MATYQRLCVFCGSSPGSKPEYTDVAVELAREMVARKIRLVYGGGNVGLMGTIAQTTLDEGGEVIGVIPQSLVDKEVAHTGLSTLHVVSSMHERKAKMAELADGFIALPGGLGTMEELFEVATWAQLGFHQKPLILLDVQGYYGALCDFLDQCVQSRFLKPDHRALIHRCTNVGDAFAYLSGFEPIEISKWIDRERSD